MLLLGRKLRLIAANGGQLARQRFADVEDDLSTWVGPAGKRRAEHAIELSTDRVRRQVVELLVPLGKARVEDGRVRDLHRLPVVRRGHRRFVAQANHKPWPVLSELDR